MSRSLVFFTALSLFAHGAWLLFVSDLSRAGAPERAAIQVEELETFVERAALKIRRVERLQEERRALVEQARKAVQTKTLKLGEFFLQSNRIDAEASNLPFDEAGARRRYEERLLALKEDLGQSDARTAVPKVFGDLRYYGKPGGFLGSALIERGGSCEQISQLVSAALHDAGLGKDAGMRFYGGALSDGTVHIAPTVAVEGVEHDLMSGQPAIQQGVHLNPEDWVEIYARAHGFAEKLKGGAEKLHQNGGQSNTNEPAPKSNTTERPSLLAGLPPNGDKYPGALPLYAASAVRRPEAGGEGAEALDLSERARDCAYFLRMAMLNPMRVEIRAPAGLGGEFHRIDVEPFRIPTPQRLEREALLLKGADELAHDGDKDWADRLMGLSCLAALGDIAAVDFSLAGEYSLASLATEQGREAVKEGKKAIGGIDWEGPEGVLVRRRLSVEYGGRMWLLLALPGGDDVVFQLARGGRPDDWGRVSALSALVLWPGTQARALQFLETLPLMDQVDVMHEIFHAHDHMRPWASNFDLVGAVEEIGKAGEVEARHTRFLEVYKVFRRMAFRLWEGQRNLAEILPEFERESEESGMEPSWRAALLTYLARNALGLLSQRAAGITVVTMLKEAVVRNGHPSLTVLRGQLEYIEIQGTLNARTLADAWRRENAGN